MDEKLNAGASLSSSDEVVDSLISDFKNSCKTSESTSSKEVEISEEPEVNTDDKEAGENKLEEKSEDFIDEEELKIKELTYSDEEKETLRKEAEDHKQEGNKQFKSCEYKESISTYTLGLRTCPLAYPKDRSILYANRAAAKVKLGEEEAAISDCTKAIELDPSYVRALLRRAQLYEATEKLDESLEDFKKILELDSSNKDALFASQRLPPLINERNEKLKTEMMGKLKDLGNMFLKPFGLSTENFKMVQDPNSGGYTINFQQKS